MDASYSRRMKLVPSSEVLNFLSQSAPRPWIKRMLQWMIYTGELVPHFTQGRIRPFTNVMSVLLKEQGLFELHSKPGFEAAVRKAFDRDSAEQLLGRDATDPVYDRAIEWSDDEEPHQVGAGMFVLADEIDWERGLLRAVWNRPDTSDDHLFWDADIHLTSEFDEPSFEVAMAGLSFPFDVIEMLQPHQEFTPVSPLRAGNRTMGRPRKWDWEGAMAHLTGVAQHPDGLPSGVAAQAQIERIMGDWFVGTTGDSPAVSQIRSRAQTIMRSIEKPKT